MRVHKAYPLILTILIEEKSINKEMCNQFKSQMAILNFMFFLLIFLFAETELDRFSPVQSRWIGLAGSNQTQARAVPKRHRFKASSLRHFYEYLVCIKCGIAFLES